MVTNNEVGSLKSEERFFADFVFSSTSICIFLILTNLNAVSDAEITAERTIKNKMIP